jgi:cytoskeleton-associated protein 5
VTFASGVCEQVKGEKPPAPTRGLRKAGASSADADDADADEGETSGEAAGGGESVNMADLIPRTDIG